MRLKLVFLALWMLVFASTMVAPLLPLEPREIFFALGVATVTLASANIFLLQMKQRSSRRKRVVRRKNLGRLLNDGREIT